MARYIERAAKQETREDRTHRICGLLVSAPEGTAGFPRCREPGHTKTIASGWMFYDDAVPPDRRWFAACFTASTVIAITNTMKSTTLTGPAP